MEIIGAIIAGIIGISTSLFMFHLYRNQDKIKLFEKTIRHKQSLILEFNYMDEQINCYLAANSSTTPYLPIERLKTMYIQGDLSQLGDDTLSDFLVGVLFSIWYPLAENGQGYNSSELKHLQADINKAVNLLKDGIESDNKAVKEMENLLYRRRMLKAIHDLLVRLRETYCYKKGE